MWKSKISVQHDWKRALFSLQPDAAQGAKEPGEISFIRAPIPFTGAPPSWPNHLPKASPTNTINLRVKISTYKPWGGGTNIRLSASGVLYFFYATWYTILHISNQLWLNTSCSPPTVYTYPFPKFFLCTQ